MKLNKAVEEFLSSSRGEVSESTRAWYGKRLGQFATYLGNVEVEGITAADLRRYRLSLLDQKVRWVDHPTRPAANSGLSVHTIHGHVRAVRRFFNWLVEEELLAASPAVKLKLPKLGTEPPKAISREDFWKLAREAGKAGRRDLAIVLFLASTGCRAGGLVNLRLVDLDLAAGEATVTEKGDVSRPVYLNRMAVEAMAAWLEVRGEGGEFVFTSQRGGKLQTTGINQLLDRLAARAGVTGRCNPHSFRHAAARGWLEAGADLGTVSELLGHSDIAVTHRFYARWSKAELKKRHERFDWLEPDSD